MDKDSYSQGYLLSRNFLILTSSSIALQVVGFIVTILIARNLGPEEFGTYNLIFYLIGIFSVFGMVGLTQVIIREVARDPAKLSLYFSGSTFIRIIFTLASCLCLYLFLIIFKRNIASPLFCLVMFCLLFQASIMDTQQSIFFGQQRMGLPSIISLVSRFSWVFMVLIFLYFHYFDVLSVLTTLIISQCLYIVGSHLFLKINFRNSLFVSFNKEFLFRLISEAWPFLILGLLSIFGGNIGKILLSIFKGDRELGFFSVADKLQLPLFLTAVALANSLYPVLSKKYNEDISRFTDLSYRAFKYNVSIFLPCCFLIAFNSKEIVISFFGAAYLESCSTLSIFIFNAGFMSSFLVIGTILAAMNQARAIVFLALAAAIINLILFYIFADLYGALGLAVAYIIGHIINITYHCYVLKRLLGKLPIWSMIFKPLAVSFLAVVPMFFKNMINFILLVPVCLILYLVLLVLLRVIDDYDKQFALAIIQQKMPWLWKIKINSSSFKA
jgi:O-antigen/teichoic acid export membrane protein